MVWLVCVDKMGCLLPGDCEQLGRCALAPGPSTVVVVSERTSRVFDFGAAAEPGPCTASLLVRGQRLYCEWPRRHAGHCQFTRAEEPPQDAAASVLVPREPTPAMIHAAYRVFGEPDNKSPVRNMWKAMCEAALMEKL